MGWDSCKSATQRIQCLRTPSGMLPAAGLVRLASHNAAIWRLLTVGCPYGLVPGKGTKSDDGRPRAGSVRIQTLNCPKMCNAC